MILTIAVVILALILTGAILLQSGEGGLGAVFGGGGNVYRTKRGIEKKLHTATVTIAILFFGIALANALF